ncbi:MAG: L,D-transpeptidase family protein [Actinobacteria bacterium]|jgi:lipoprotein-anchoring transpeptidase ErfK/SrfK|nr:L,D-transpeptidase family protein [Actinomycetota bacterium]
MRKLVGVALLMLVLVLLGGCQIAASPGTVTTSPANGATDVSPTSPVTVTIDHGKLTQVALTNPEGKPVAGALSADGDSWKATEPLGYGKRYTYSGTATDADGKPVPVTGSFTTVKPKALVSGTLNIHDGDTVGVAAPIILQFDDHVADQAAAQRALQVQTSVPAEGSWAWLPDDNGRSRVHWRSKDYLQPGTQVTVAAKLYGVNYGQGGWGQEDLSLHFTVGRAQIVKADVNSHHMVVIRDGQTVMDFPASYGLGADPNRVTRSGTHVVMSKSPLYLMSNPAYGYVNFPSHWSVRISNNGEFIHANPETTGVQGEANVTHGCVNLSTANAKEYFDSALFGDPVEVTGSQVAMSPADGDIYDWTVPWDQWKSMSALH